MFCSITNKHQKFWRGRVITELPCLPYLVLDRLQVSLTPPEHAVILRSSTSSDPLTFSPSFRSRCLPLLEGNEPTKML